MNTKSKALLEEKMQEFLEENDSGVGNEGWMGDNMHKLMANAAEAVYDCSRDVEKYMAREGIEPKAHHTGG